MERNLSRVKPYFILNKNRLNKYMLFLIFLGSCVNGFAQTEKDKLMMKKGELCTSFMHGTASWEKYWEGKLERENLNLGKVITKSARLMGNYGISDKLNILYNVPYIKTRATAGQLAGQQGIQDLSIFIKYKICNQEDSIDGFSSFIVGGYSTPLTNYTPDILPLSIGLQSKTASIRALGNYGFNNFFVTGSVAYIRRSNVFLDRNSYFTTELNYTNEVKMPDAVEYNLRIGYQKNAWFVEAILNDFNTLGGFDISKNNAPFVSNNVRSTQVSAHLKYDTKVLKGLAFIADVGTTVAGRNSGKLSYYDAGLIYFFNLTGSSKKNKN